MRVMQRFTRLRTHPLTKYVAIALATLLLISLMTAIWMNESRSSDTKPIHLAIAAPITGLRNTAAKEMVQSVQLYLDSLNQNGGVNGHPLKLLVFDDRGDPNAARQIPRQVDDSPALVVLGHLNSFTSVEAAPIYNALRIPAITATSSEDYITQANPYYFRTVFTNSVQGSVVALYIQRILNFKTASIIYSDDRLGQTLDEAFEATFKQEGTIKNTWKIDPKGHNVRSSINIIISELAAEPNPGMVFLAMDDVMSKDFIVAIRRRGLKTPLFGSQSLVRETSFKLFEQYEEEKRQPGYFLDGIYIPSPLIFDSAGTDAQEFASLYKKAYRDSPTYVGTAYYDAARIAVRAIQQADIKNTSTSYKEDRQKIRDQLEQINRRDVALKGLNGPIYFDLTHDNTPPVRIGRYVGQRLISAPVQLSPINTLSGVDLERELKTGNILTLTYRLKKQYFWRQQVVYTGIDLNQISQVDQRKSSFTADFYLWVRYPDGADATNIKFPGGTNLVPSQPLFTPDAPLETGKIDGLNYRLYQIRGEFKTPFDLHDYPFDQQNLAIRFQNTATPSDRLIYVIDTFGLRLPQSNTEAEKKPYQTLQLWKFEKLQYAQEVFQTNSTEGDPRLFDTNNPVDYPGLSATVTVQRRSLVFLIKNLLPLFLLTLVPMTTLYFPDKISKDRPPVAVAALISGTVLLVGVNNQLPEVGYTVALEYFFYVFFGLSLFAVAIAVVSDRLTLKGYKLSAKRLDYTARIVYVLIVVLTAIVYWVVFGERIS